LTGQLPPNINSFGPVPQLSRDKPRPRTQPHDESEVLTRKQRNDVLLAFIAIVTLAISLTAFSFAQTQYAVGTRQPHLTFYATISQAGSSVPSGATIEARPGHYPEQVLITQPLTLEGIAVGSSDTAAVTVPSGGLTQSVSDPTVGPVYYQILVQTTGPVNISNLVVDGTNGSGPSGAVAGMPSLLGFLRLDAINPDSC
jgi:hypothetical protein